jgi:hypothetical protein
VGESRGFGDRLGEATAGSRSLRYISCWLETLYYPGVDLDCKRCVKELNRQKILKSQNEEKVRIKVLKMNRFLGCIQSPGPASVEFGAWATRDGSSIAGERKHNQIDSSFPLQLTLELDFVQAGWKLIIHPTHYFDLFP